MNNDDNLLHLQTVSLSEDRYLHCYARGRSVVESKNFQISKTHSPLGREILVAMKSANDFLCDGNWCSVAEEAYFFKRARAEIKAEYLAVHERWSEFVDLVTLNKKARKYIIRTHAILTSRGIGFSENRKKLKEARNICASLEAQAACWDALL